MSKSKIGGGKVKSSDVTADILNFIADGKIHTLQEIADEVECSKMTVRRHIDSLRFRFPILHCFGNGKQQGVFLDKTYTSQERIRTNDELQIIHKALVLLQESNCEKVDPKLLNRLIEEFTPTNQKKEMSL